MPKQSGKTTELLKGMVEDDRIVYVGATRGMMVFAYQQAQRMGLDLPRERFMCMAQVVGRGGIHNAYDIVFAVDELELCLEYMMGGIPVEIATITEGDEEQILF